MREMKSMRVMAVDLKIKRFKVILIQNHGMKGQLIPTILIMSG